MDPTIGISLSASILTLLDFADTVMWETYILSPGRLVSTTENPYVRAILEDLDEIASDIWADFPGQSKDEQALQELVSQCEDLGNELQRILEPLSVSGIARLTWEGLKVALKSIHRENEIEALENRIRDCRAQTYLQLTQILTDEQSSVAQQLRRLEMAQAYQSVQSAARLLQLREDIIRETSGLAGKIHDMPDASERSGETRVETKQARWELRKSLVLLSSIASSVPKENMILESLFFSSKDRREDSIAVAEKGTFDWIFDEKLGPGSSIRWQRSERRTQIRALFTTWLRSGNGVFHISGKSGSGKSMLMKYLYKHEKTVRELEAWAGKKILICARFYFSKSTDPMQTSLDGLYRSILFDILQQCPSLMRTACRKQWELLERGTLATQSSLGALDILDGLETIIDHGTFPNHRFCFFIDALDECDGTFTDHLRLVTTLRRWTRAGGVKICVTSKPNAQFDDLPSPREQIIHLDEATKLEMSDFAQSTMETGA